MIPKSKSVIAVALLAATLAAPVRGENSGPQIADFKLDNGLELVGIELATPGMPC